MTAVAGPTPYGANNNTSPGQDGFAITPSNSLNFVTMARAIYVGVGGDISLVTANGTTLLFVGVLQGSILPITCIRVNSTGTGASSLVAIT